MIRNIELVLGFSVDLVATDTGTAQRKLARYVSEPPQLDLVVSVPTRIYIIDFIIESRSYDMSLPSYNMIILAHLPKAKEVTCLGR